MKHCLQMSLVILLALGAIALSSAPASAQDAAATYKSKCAMCHGANGEGKAAMKTKDFSSPDVQKMSDADLADVIAKGKAPMKGYEGTLSKDQINDLVKWIRTLKK